jgi:hypothetical protein
MMKSTPRTQEQRQEQDQRLEAIYDDIALSQEWPNQYTSQARTTLK